MARVYTNVMFIVTKMEIIKADHKDKMWVLVNDEMHVELKDADWLRIGDDTDGKIAVDKWGYTYYYPNKPF